MGQQRATVVLKLIELRLLVGALGERLGWWPSRFTDNVGLRSLAVSFPRTTLRAALESVTVAARRDHDERLHPDCIHLFRLDAAQEDAIAHCLDQGTVKLDVPPAETEALLAALDLVGKPEEGPPPVGPCSLGKAVRIHQHSAVVDLARTYASAARSGQRAIPYFEEQT